MRRVMIGAMLACCLIATAAPTKEKGTSMTERASGTFEVKVEPIAEEASSTGPALPRYALQKQFSGDVEGTSQGQMMAFDAGVEGSGAYVAIERVTGSVRGRKGSFALMHNGTMRKGGDYRLEVKVIPDSGTEQLAGISGTMQIVIEGGKHIYHLDYSFE